MVLVCETYISLNQVFKHDQDELFYYSEGVKVF